MPPLVATGSRCNMQKLAEIYAGKAKSIYSTDNPDYVIVHFRDDASAFNGVKLAKLARKGMVNNAFNAFIMQYLEKAGIATHFVEKLNQTESLVRKVEIIPVECVVRNVAAGNLCKRYGIEQGLKLDPPLFEFFLKSDPLGDPPISEEHIRAFKWATPEEVAQLKALSYKVNDLLKPLFEKAGMTLVDFKLEFGRHKGNLLLADEFSPDGCRVWDTQTQKILDKDRFRQDLGDVVESYEEMAHRLGISV